MEEYVSVDISKKLKEKGFPQGNKNDITEKYYTISDSLKAAVMLANNEDVKWYCPTISQVLKWLRDEKKLYVYPYLVPGKNGLKWDFNIDDLNTGWIIFESRAKYYSYEEAAIAGIEYVLNNII